MQTFQQAAGDRRGDARDQGRRITKVGGKTVTRLVGEPVAVPATDDIHADHAVVCFQRGGETVEVAAVARQTVHAEYDVRIARIAPLCVGNAMETVRAETEEALLRHQGHGWTRTMRLRTVE